MATLEEHFERAMKGGLFGRERTRAEAAADAFRWYAHDNVGKDATVQFCKDPVRGGWIYTSQGRILGTAATTDFPEENIARTVEGIALDTGTTTVFIRGDQIKDIEVTA